MNGNRLYGCSDNVGPSSRIFRLPNRPQDGGYNEIGS